MIVWGMWNVSFLIYRFLYYTDWGSSGAVIRTALDGSNPVEIIRDMDNPNAVLISKSGDIYVLDSHDKSVDRNGVLYKMSNDESGNVAKVEIEELKLEVYHLDLHLDLGT